MKNSIKKITSAVCAFAILSTVSALNITPKTAHAAHSHSWTTISYQAHTYKTWTETYWAGGRIVTAYKSSVHTDKVQKCSCGNYRIVCP